jgi:hypothetical protein
VADDLGFDAHRNQVMSDVEYVLNEGQRIEEKMKQRQELLRSHDALYRLASMTSAWL